MDHKPRIHLTERAMTMPIIPQADYPNVDLYNGNAELLKELISGEAGVEGQGVFFEDAQRQTYQLAITALQLFLGMQPRYNRSEYRSFTEGFAAFEAIAARVRSQPTLGTNFLTAPVYNIGNASRRAHSLLLGETRSSEHTDTDPDTLIVLADGNITTTGALEQADDEVRRSGNPTAANELAMGYDTWYKTMPNTFSVIHDTTPSRRTDNERFARIMGARIAYEFQRAS